MRKRIRVIFVAEDKDYQVQPTQALSYTTLMTLVEKQRQKYENPLKPVLKVLIRKEAEDQRFPKYIKISKEEEVIRYIRNSQITTITVEFFYSKKEETIRRSITKIGEMLDKRQKQLRNLTKELKDEVNQLNALRFIRKSTSPDDEQTIEVFLLICDPLVEAQRDNQNNQINYPLFHDQIDLPNHIQRLRKASLSNGDFKIKAKRVWGTKRELQQTLLHGTEGDRQRKVFTIVQIFTRVERRNGTLMISLECEGKQLGKRDWQEAASLFKGEVYANIIIIVGIGVNQLSELAKQLNFNKPLILISTISLEDKRIITTTCDRSLIDIENTYNDNYCQVFLESFYYNLFRRHDVRKCYQMAIKEISQPNIKSLWCCCLHAHDPDCNWFRIVKTIGELQAHRLLKHDQYLKGVLNKNRKKIQELLLNNEALPTCATDAVVCCWEKISDKSNLAFHETFDKSIIWNEREPDEVYYHLEPQQEMPNRFESQTYDKPTGRRRPLTIFKVLQHLLQNDICILRAPIISQAKRYFSFAREYLQVRNPCLFFHEFETGNLHDTINFKKKAQQLIQQRKAPLGASVKSRRTQWIFLMHYSHEKNDRYYQSILMDFVDIASYFSREAKFKLVLLTDDPNFFAIKIINMLTKTNHKNQKVANDLIISDPFDIEDDNPLEKCHNIITRHSSEYVIKNIQSIKKAIEAEPKQELQKEEQQLQKLKDNYRDQYYFLGFLSQFSEDGFYLNTVSRIILTELFGREIIEKAVNNELPVENINLADFVYLQLQKAYHGHFKHPDNIYRLYFQQKKLEFYFLLMKLYFEYWPKANMFSYPAVIRQFINKQGIFSIDIELEWDQYEPMIEACIREIEPIQEEIKEILFDINNPIHVYHLTQVEKILQEFLKKKRNKHNPTTSQSFLGEKQFKIFQYLLWNIIQKSWLMSQVLYKHYEENIKRFQMVLIIFFIQAQILQPISEVARIQMHFLMNKCPPKLEDYQFSFNKLTIFLRFYRNYAFKSMALDNLEPSWGNHHKYKEIIESCFNLASIIGKFFNSTSKWNFYQQKKSQKKELQQKGEDQGEEEQQAEEDENKEKNKKKKKKKKKQMEKDPYQGIKESERKTPFLDYVNRYHKMFKNTNESKWLHESLKKIEKKVLYYFKFTYEMKHNQGYEEYNQKMLAFERQFKLGSINYQLDGFKLNLPREMLQQKETKLIKHYLRVNLEEIEVDKDQLTDFEGKISSQYMPIFIYLCQKVEQKALFNQTGLVIFARARNLVWNGKPYFYSRRRTLLSYYLGQVFRERELKICYFPLTEKVFNILEIKQNKNPKCEVLCMILTVDCVSGDYLLFGSEQRVQTARISIDKFIEKIKSCRIKLLILCGKDSTKVCKRIKEKLSSNEFSSGVNLGMTNSVIHNAPKGMACSTIRGPMSSSTIKQSSTSHSAIKSSVANGKDESNSSKIKGSGSSSSGLKTKLVFPTVIAIQNTKFSLCDAGINAYKPKGFMNVSDKSKIRQNRPSLFSNPKISIVEEKQEIIEEQLEKEQAKKIDQNHSEKHQGQVADEFELIDNALKEQGEHQNKIETVDDSGRNRFFAKLQEGRSEGASQPYEQQEESGLFSITQTQVQDYLANEINSTAIDLLIISIAKRIVDRVSNRGRTFTQQMIKDIIEKSIDDIKHILKRRFDCTDVVFKNICYDYWVNNQIISKVQKGTYQDLTQKFYCAENNLLDEIYYENIGHCQELNEVFEALATKRVNCISIIGGLRGEKSNFLQEVCWTAQTKGLFKFGTFKYDLKDGNLNTLLARTFKERDSRSNETGILIAFDNIDDKLSKFRRDLLKLKGKSFTVIYTAQNKALSDQIRELLGFTEHLCIDFDKRSQAEVNNFIYANLLSHIKEKNEFRFTSQILSAYQTKIDQIMKVIQRVQNEDKLVRALQLLRGSNPRSEDEKMSIYYNFYKQQYDQLIMTFEQIKEITLKII